MLAEKSANSAVPQTSERPTTFSRLDFIQRSIAGAIIIASGRNMYETSRDENDIEKSVASAERIEMNSPSVPDNYSEYLDKELRTEENIGKRYLASAGGLIFSALLIGEDRLRNRKKSQKTTPLSQAEE